MKLCYTIQASPRLCTLYCQKWQSQKALFKIIFLLQKTLENIYYLLLRGKTFHFPDASTSENIIDLLLKFLEVIPLSYILHSWSSCHHYPCISITTYICPFPWERRNRIMLSLLKCHIHLNFCMSSLRSSKIKAWKFSLGTPNIHKILPLNVITFLRAISTSPTFLTFFSNSTYHP